MAVQHYYEPTDMRRVRIGGNSHGQALCSSGDAHQSYAPYKEAVTCPACLKLLKEDWFP